MAASTHFKHTELYLAAKHIRLVEIMPGSLGKEVEVHCKIHVKSREEQPEYVALSYTWGSATTNWHIFLDGRRYPVRKNLFRFLHTMASKITTGTLYWIDARSIDQANDKERTHQVSLMSQIYRSASRVYVWLGPAYEDSDRAMQAISLEPSFWVAKGRMLKIWRKPLGSADRKLCDRPYWRRLWIFQELMLAREISILCGRRDIDGRRFVEFLLQVRALDGIRAPPPEEEAAHDDGTHEEIAFADEHAGCSVRIQRPLGFEHELMLNCSAIKLVIQMRHTRLKPSLLQLMEATRHLHCSEPKDIVYALLGIAESGHEGIPPDYTIALSTLLNNILRNMHQLNPPTDIQEVEQQCRHLADMFEVSTSSIFSLQGSGIACERLSPASGPLFSLGLPGSGVNHWWTGMYEHKAVERILLESDVLPWSTVLSRALAEECEEVAERLLDAGVGNNFTLDTACISASSKGMMAIVAKILGELVESRDMKMCKVANDALCSACANGQDTTVQFLLDTGADADAQCLNGNALHLASKAGHENVVRILISKGAQIDGTEHECGITPLTFACMMGRINMVQILLDYGASVNMSHVKGSTALAAASGAGHEKIVRMLLKSDADINTIDGWGETALTVASWEGHENIVRLLLENCANVQGGRHRNALIAASLRPESNGVVFPLQPDKTRIARMLLEHGADVNAECSRYGSALVAASQAGSEAIVQMLLDQGADINASSDKLGTAIEPAYTQYRASMLQASRLTSDATDRASDILTRFKHYHEIIPLLPANGAAFSARSEYAKVDYLNFDVVYILEEEMLAVNDLRLSVL